LIICGLFAPVTSCCDSDFWPFTLTVCSRSHVTWSISLPHLREVEQSQAELLTIQPIFKGRWRTFKLYTVLLRGMDQTASNLLRREQHHPCTRRDTSVPMRCFVLKWRQLKDEWCGDRRKKISHCLTTCKN